MEAWTVKNKALKKKIMFQMWLYHQILIIPWTKRIRNKEVLHRVKKFTELVRIQKDATVFHKSDARRKN